ncbi:hypothetical protein GCM10009753_57930 [Streptantibioticus ferralitis]
MSRTNRWSPGFGAGVLNSSYILVIIACPGASGWDARRCLVDGDVLDDRVGAVRVAGRAVREPVHQLAEWFRACTRNARRFVRSVLAYTLAW